MGAGAKTDPTLIEIRDIAKSHHCPLAHMLRKRLHKAGIRTGFRVVFSPEAVREGAMILCEETNKKSNVGTISYMPALFGCHCASGRHPGADRGIITGFDKKYRRRPQKPFLYSYFSIGLTRQGSSTQKALPSPFSETTPIVQL